MSLQRYRPCLTQTIYIAPVCPIAQHVKPLLSVRRLPLLLAAPLHFFSLCLHF